MLIELLNNDAQISQYFCDECSENGVAIEIDPTIQTEDLCIIKVDDYYNSFKMEHRPKSPDCLIIQRCSDSDFIVYIIELRDIKNSAGFKVDEIIDKFTTCLDDFMGNKFAHIFHFENSTFNYKNIHLLFVSDPYDFKKQPEKQDKMRGHKIDALMAQRIPKYFGKHLHIDYKLPNPTITNCKANQNPSMS